MAVSDKVVVELKRTGQVATSTCKLLMGKRQGEQHWSTGGLGLGAMSEHQLYDGSLVPEQNSHRTISNSSTRRFSSDERSDEDEPEYTDSSGLVR